MTHEQFTQIYLPFSGKMYALAYNLLRNRDEARDCMQDVYSELWIKRDTIEPDKPPLPFVLTMVRNNCLDRLKSRSAQADDETLETLLDHNTENQIEAASGFTIDLPFTLTILNEQFSYHRSALLRILF